MLRILAALLAALELFAVPALRTSLPEKLQSGEWLRFHVVAQDDTDEMQRLKYCVRDAVQACYLQHRTAGASSMQAQAEALLPLLQEAALLSARQEGFTGPVQVTISRLPFDERELMGMTVPAGDYPALMILLGDAQGRNWWGLLDPELSVQLARVPQAAQQGGGILWDWSWQALLSALFGWPLTVEGA